MLFQGFVDLYFKDMGHRLKESTIISKHYMIDKKILPIFGKMPINEITPKDIRKWQNRLTAYCDENGNPYAQTYLKTPKSNRVVTILQMLLECLKEYMAKCYKIQP